LLNRLDVPSAGRALLADADTAALDVHELRRRVGMVMQLANLFPGTVAQNVGYGPAQRGVVLKADEWRSCCARSALRTTRSAK
jgi:UDP-glucose/iron transport system ATP-binding protein